jgi:hypothetical protein
MRTDPYCPVTAIGAGSRLACVPVQVACRYSEERTKSAGWSGRLRWRESVHSCMSYTVEFKMEVRWSRFGGALACDCAYWPRGAESTARLFGEVGPALSEAGCDECCCESGGCSLCGSPHS